MVVMLYTISSIDAITNIIDGLSFASELADKGVPYDQAIESYPDYYSDHLGQFGLAYAIKDISDEAGEYGISLSGKAPSQKIITRVNEAAAWLDGRVKETGEPLCMELADAYIKALQAAAGEMNTAIETYRHEEVKEKPHQKALEVALRIVVNATETVLTKDLRKNALNNGKNTNSLAKYLMTHPYPVGARIFRAEQPEHKPDWNMPTGR